VLSADGSRLVTGGRGRVTERAFRVALCGCLLRDLAGCGLPVRAPVTRDRRVIPLVRPVRHLPRILDHDDVIRLVAALRKDRDRAMIDAMLLAGLRRCEVLGLRLQDVRWGERRLFIADGKGGALGAVNALTEGDWGDTGALEVRVSVHAGTASERDGDFFGPPVNKVARINGIGHGGQVLESDVARQLMVEPTGLDLGVHQLRDLSEPVRLWQLDDGVYPSLRTLKAAPDDRSVSAQSAPTDLTTATSGDSGEFGVRQTNSLR
jgi:class 3 adenylate cyclase